MKKIKEYIERELQIFKEKKINKDIKEKEINDSKKELIQDFNIWIKNLYMSMHSSKFRQVLTEIETKKKIFITIPEYHWKYQIIQIKAMFRIIQKKIKKYGKILSNDFCNQNRSILFWFNQIVLILEQLNLNFRDDLNDNLAILSANEPLKSLIPIKYIYHSYIKLIYLLIKYSYIRGDYQDILAYVAIVDDLANYSMYIININSMPIIQRIFLVKSKIFLANCDYLNANKYITKTIDLCIEQINLLVDYRADLQSIVKDDDIDLQLFSKKTIKILQSVLINIILDFYLRGVLSELIGSTPGAIDSYKQSKFFSTKFLKDKFYNFTMFFYHLQNNGFRYLAVMEEFKELKQIREEQANLKKIELYKKNLLKKIRYQRNYNKFYSNIRTKHDLYKGNLKKFLDNVTNKTYKEEENRQGILAKFRKSKYITSTMSLINIYLSDDFKEYLKKMKSIELSKYPKEVNSFLTYFAPKKNKSSEDNKSLNNSISINGTRSKSKNSKNISKDLNLNESSQHTTNNFVRFNRKTNSMTTKNSILSGNNNIINFNIYNFNNSINNINYRYSNEITKNHLNNSGSFKSMINEKKLTDDTSYSPKVNKKRINHSFINALNKIDNDLHAFNLKNVNSTKNIFHKKQNDFSFILNKNKELSSIDSREDSKNNSPTKKKLLSRQPNRLKIFKLKINKSKINKSSNKSKEHKDEYEIDKNYFNKSLYKKKEYIEKYCTEELKFHKKLLHAKSCEIEPFKDEKNELDLKKSALEAETTYSRILEICKSNLGKKNFDSFFKNVKLIKDGATKNGKKIKFEKQNSLDYNLAKKKKFDLNKIYPNNQWSIVGKNYVMQNNLKQIKILDFEYIKAINKTNELIRYKKMIFNK